MIVNWFTTKVKYLANQSIEPQPLIKGPALWVFLSTVAFLFGIAIIILAFIYQSGTGAITPSSLIYLMIAVLAYVSLFFLAMRLVQVEKNRVPDYELRE